MELSLSVGLGYAGSLHQYGGSKRLNPCANMIVGSSGG
jgi:hypothetical protein